MNNNKTEEKDSKDNTVDNINNTQKSEPIMKTGEDLQVGDVIEVQWGQSIRGKIVGFKPYEGNLKSVYPTGCRRVIFEDDKRGIPVGNDELVSYFGNEEVSFFDVVNNNNQASNSSSSSSCLRSVRSIARTSPEIDP